jgi:hypothetical protein
VILDDVMAPSHGGLISFKLAMCNDRHQGLGETIGEKHSWICSL